MASRDHILKYEFDDADDQLISDWLQADGRRVELSVQHAPAGEARVEFHISKGRALLDLYVSKEVYDRLA